MKPGDLAHGNSEAAIEMLKALGLIVDDHVVGFTVRVRGGKLVKVFVEYNVTEKNLSAFASVFKRYGLVMQETEKAA